MSSLPVVGAAEAHGRARHPEGQSRARRLRRQGRRPRAHSPHRHGTRLRQRRRFASPPCSAGSHSTPATCCVIRYEGPRGGPGMREMLAVTAAIKGIPELSENRRPAHGRPLLRRDPRPHGRACLPPRPSSAAPSPPSTKATRLPSTSRTASSTLNVPDEEIVTLASRTFKVARAPRYKRGVFAKYVNTVSSASQGAVTT